MTDQSDTRGFRALLGTQFLGAFNDNAFKLFICLVALHEARSVKQGTAVFALAGALFTLPFILFAPAAGWLADRFSKRRVVIWTKITEVVVMAASMAALAMGSLPAMLVVLFLMATQSTFFGPAKYGLLPELLRDEDLSAGNGQLQMWSFAAIILGTAAGSWLYHTIRHEIWLLGGFFVGVAVLGALWSLRVSPVAAAAPERAFRWRPLSEPRAALRELRGRRPLVLCIVGLSFFWFVGALLHANLLLHAAQVMTRTSAGLLLGVLAGGVALGSLLAGRASGEIVEFGLVPIGAALMMVGSASVPFFTGSVTATYVALAGVGIGGGLFIVPLSTYVQETVPPHERGRILAFQGLVTSAAVLLSYPILSLLRNGVGLSTGGIFLVTSLLLFLATVYITTTVPQFLTRMVLWVLTRIFFRVRCVGRDNLPKEGGALLVCNHVAHADALLVQACTSRILRHVMHQDFYTKWWSGPIARLMGYIPVSADAPPRETLRALRVAADRVAAGELVCIFAEGAITRTGNLLPFNRGLEVIMRRTDAPIIPVYLDQVWGGISSMVEGRPRRLPDRIPHPVTIAFGEPMPATSTAQEVRQRVQEMGAECAKRRGDQELLSTRFVRQARRHPFRFCMTDDTGRELNYAKACIGSLAMSRAIARRVGDDEMVGILLPNCIPGALTNVAVTILGKATVNLNFTTGAESLDAAIGKCGLRHIFTSRRAIQKLGIAPRAEMVFLEDFAAVVSRWDRLLSACAFVLFPHRLLRRLFRQSRQLNTGSLATVMFSSGSTGNPKGVMLCHANLNANIEALYKVFSMHSGDRMLGNLPFFHSFGLTVCLWLPLCTGTGVVLQRNPLDVKKVGTQVQAYGVTLLAATPTFLGGYLRRCTREQFATLRHVATGAEKLRPQLADAFEERFGLRPLEGYGCTELAPFATLNLPDFRNERVDQVGHKEGSIGHPLPGIAARIVHPETFVPVAEGEEGMLLIKGANVMLGYLGEPELTAAVIHDGWYVTGDIAVLDADGFITIRGRLSRFSKIAGEMVPHIRVEEVIAEAIGVTDERACVVTGVPDEQRGERLVVLHRPGLDIPSLCRALLNSGLPKLWLPKADAFMEVADFPLLGTGKLDLCAIKELAVA
jgi:acyl-[acyl-carrier-protein]-phospholipid O-acyltransferase / long-chain-fatty-acid--[acyl-carrier-protein] ligase